MIVGTMIVGDGVAWRTLDVCGATPRTRGADRAAQGAPNAARSSFTITSGTSSEAKCPPRGSSFQ